ncbi:putative endopeptidase [Pararobbsia alpina]
MVSLKSSTTAALLLSALVSAVVSGHASAAPANAIAENASGAASRHTATLGSGIDRQYFDHAVRPQDDFFRAVNGAWLSTTQIPADRSSFGSFNIVRDTTEEQLHTIIEADASTHAAAGTSTQRIGDLYASFMDEATIEKLGIHPLDAELARIDAMRTPTDVASEFGHLSTLGIGTPVHIDIHQDNRDATRYIVDIQQGGTSLPDRDYYLQLDDKRFTDVRAKYVAYIEHLMTLSGDANAAAEAPKVLAFETALAKIQWDKVTLRDPVKAYNKVSMAELAKLSPSFDWPAYADAAGFAGKVDSVIVGQPTYVSALDALLTQTPVNDIKVYLRWKLINGFAGSLPKAFDQAHFAFYGTVIQGQPEDRARWKRGVSLVSGSIGEDLGQAYVAQYFPPERKARLDALVTNLLAAYRHSMSTLTWMGPETRKQALAKLGKLTVKIGYPSKWRDYSSIVIRRDDLIGNIMRTSAFAHAYDINKLGKPVDRTEWQMTPQTVNAYYDPEKNEIVFPAAIMQPPFFHADADDAVNYGAIGAVIGHEISHGFDDQGAQYDGDGNLRDWWTPEDHKQFEAMTHRLVAQYDAFSPVEGYHVNGSLTLGENIADNSGLAVAYKAYELSLHDKPSPVIDGMTGEQRFYYGFAQVWRGKSRDAAVIAQIKSDPHSPFEFRVEGPVRNQPGFYNAFGVKPGDALYLAPKDRVIMW